MNKLDYLWGHDRECHRAFLAMSQDKKLDKSILEGRHILSKYFEVMPFVVMEAGTPLARCIVTIYPEDKTAYLGFFQSQDREEACQLLFSQAEAYAKERGCDRICGPVDASIWIRYRFKVNNFHLTYTGEPDNKPYYARLWQACGYEVSDRYFSNRYRRVNKDDTNAKYIKRLKYFKEQDYRFVNLDMKLFDATLREIYRLLIDLYSGFRAYKFVSEQDFVSMFSSLKLIINPSMAKLAYKGDRLCGFFICIPNYEGLTDNINLPNIIKMLKIRKSPEEYVIMYAGVDRDQLGLGSAMAELIKLELLDSQCTSVGALCHENNMSNSYYKELVENRFEYVLMKKELSHEEG